MRGRVADWEVTTFLPMLFQLGQATTSPLMMMMTPKYDYTAA